MGIHLPQATTILGILITVPFTYERHRLIFVQEKGLNLQSMACPRCSRRGRPRNKRPNAAVGWGSSHLSSQSPTWRKRRRERIRQVSLIQYQSRIPVYYNESIYQKRKLSSPNYLFFLPTLHQCQNLPKIVEQPRHCSWSRCFQSIVFALLKHAPKLATYSLWIRLLNMTKDVFKHGVWKCLLRKLWSLYRVLSFL